VRRFRLFACLLLPLLLLTAACGDDGGSDEPLQADEEDAEAAGVPDATVGDAAEDDPSLDAITVGGTFDESATVEVDGPFTTETTYRRVLEEGDGDPVEAGQSVDFQNVAVNGRDGVEFDNSYEASGEGGGPPSIVMDETQIIPGLVRGLIDVPVGSRVLIAVAPQDGFQEQGGIPDAGIEADDTIIFVVDVLEATTPTAPLDRAEGTEVEPDEGLPTVELDDTGKPTITLPEGDPPTELVTQVLIEGDGAEVESGQTITAHYTGVIWPGGEQFDSSWDRGEPADFPIGVGGVIPGWDEGLVGQTVGSQILLVIPPDQGYGPDGNADAGISGTDTLVFVVDILAAA
jgi:peptidylprolyl isomerase